MKNNQEESEFGKGLIICLVKFAEHQSRWHEDKKVYSSMKMDISDAVHMHFNAASDHLYQIEVPEKWKGTEIDKLVTELQDKYLDIGHGFSGDGYTEADVSYAYNLCRQIALLIDKEIGLEPQIGKW